MAKPVISVLVNSCTNSTTLGAWPPPHNVADAASFVAGATAAEITTQLQGQEPIGLMWIAGAPGTEAAKLLAEVPSIGWIHSFSAGVDKLAPFLDPARPVATTNGRGAFSSSLAEYAMATALHFTKNLDQCAVNASAKRWDQFTMPVLRGKTVGLVGYGDIAKETAKLAEAFGMRVIACRRTPGDGIKTYSPDDRLQLFAEADVVVCSLPSTPQTLDFCGAAEFQAMKPTGIFISIGRGSVVDEDALCDVLKAGSIRGAALDVFKTEPLPEHSPLWNFGPDKLILTSHNADMTDDYYKLGWQIWRDNLTALLNAPSSTAVDWVTPFDPSAGY